MFNMKYSNIILLLLLLLFQSYNSIKMDLLKRQSSYKVEGCFSAFTVMYSRSMTGDNSNVRCQDICRGEGFILAATKGYYCMCGNVYPQGNIVSDTNCNTPCRSWAACSSVQSCCGGSRFYTISVVGDIDVSKQVLRRLVHVWQTNEGYRNYMKAKVPPVSSPNRYYVNWWDSFNKAGWSTCSDGYYMQGLMRNDCDELYCIEEATCLQAASDLYSSGEMDCYSADWSLSFDKQGWSKCKRGYYMTGLDRSKYNNLYNLEHARCCRPKSQVSGQWGACYENADIYSSFDHRGWAWCHMIHTGAGYRNTYMAGLYRSDCERIHCIERFLCCAMGAYNGDSWIDNPTFSINVKDTSGEFKHCTMEANDKTSSSTTYSCKPLTKHNNMLVLNAKSFNIVDETPLNVAKPKPIENFRPVICSSYSSSYKCEKDLSVKISSDSSFTISSGFSASVMVGTSVEIGSEFFGTTMKTSLQKQVSGTTSLNTASSTSNGKSVTDSTHVSIDVPVNTEITINLMRTVVDISYKWKAVFELLGKYNVKWKDSTENLQDVTIALDGSDRQLYAFGKWQYPGTDVIRVIITDKYGHEKHICDHDSGKKTNCTLESLEK